MSMVSELGLGAQGRSLQNLCTAWPPPQPVIPSQALRSFICQHKHTPVLSALPLVSPRKFGTRLRSSSSSSLSFWCKASLIRPIEVHPPLHPHPQVHLPDLWLLQGCGLRTRLSFCFPPIHSLLLPGCWEGARNSVAYRLKEGSSTCGGPGRVGHRTIPKHSLAQPWHLVDS